MSYYEALADNIRISKKNGFTIYSPPCHICGASVESWNYVSGLQYTCTACREMLIDSHNQTSNKQQDCLNRAIKRISKITDISKYKHGIQWVQDNIGKSGWFQSTEEVMVTLELIRRKVNAHHQVKVYNYVVDFVLPEMKVILEIDGKLYHGKEKKQYETIRDELICEKFGEEWELIRIDTENINTNVTRLLLAINAVLRRRKRNKEGNGHDGNRISGTD